MRVKESVVAEASRILQSEYGIERISSLYGTDEEKLVTPPIGAFSEIEGEPFVLFVPRWMFVKPFIKRFLEEYSERCGIEIDTVNGRRNLDEALSVIEPEDITDLSSAFSYSWRSPWSKWKHLGNSTIPIRIVPKATKSLSDLYVDGDDPIRLALKAMEDIGWKIVDLKSNTVNPEKTFYDAKKLPSSDGVYFNGNLWDGDNFVRLRPDSSTLREVVSETEGNSLPWEFPVLRRRSAVTVRPVYDVRYSAAVAKKAPKVYMNDGKPFLKSQEKRAKRSMPWNLSAKEMERLGYSKADVFYGILDSMPTIEPYANAQESVYLFYPRVIRFGMDAKIGFAAPVTKTETEVLKSMVSSYSSVMTYIRSKSGNAESKTVVRLAKAFAYFDYTIAENVPYGDVWENVHIPALLSSVSFSVRRAIYKKKEVPFSRARKEFVRFLFAYSLSKEISSIAGGVPSVKTSDFTQKSGYFIGVGVAYGGKEENEFFDVGMPKGAPGVIALFRFDGEKSGRFVMEKSSYDAVKKNGSRVLFRFIDWGDVSAEYDRKNSNLRIAVVDRGVKIDVRKAGKLESVPALLEPNITPITETMRKFGVDVIVQKSGSAEIDVAVSQISDAAGKRPPLPPGMKIDADVEYAVESDSDIPAKWHLVAAAIGLDPTEESAAKAAIAASLFGEPDIEKIDEISESLLSAGEVDETTASVLSSEIAESAFGNSVSPETVVDIMRSIRIKNISAERKKNEPDI